MFTKADLELAERHLAMGEQHVAEQDCRISRLSLAGAEMPLARELLETLRTALLIKRRDLELIAVTFGGK